MKDADALIGRWVAGDPAAADALYRHYHARVRRFAGKLCRNFEDADEVAQEAMVAGLEGLQAGRRPDRLTTWLMGIAKNLSRRPRRGVAMPEVALPDPRGHGARTQAVRNELEAVLRGGLDGLSAENREMLQLIHRDGLSRRTIARRMGLDIGAVHARCERAYARLRGALSRHFTTLAFRPSAVVPLGAIRKLRPAFRDAVIARHLDGLGEKAAAARLGIPTATLRARLESAYAMLKCAPTSNFDKARKAYRAESAAE
jgi:RNA polymerase sigma-70 factor (ECF subfamily)